jgi:aquaporin Z
LQAYCKYAIGTEAFLGTNSPNYTFALPLIFGIEILAAALLMVVILVVIYTEGLKGFSGIVIGRIVGLDIFFLASISGACESSHFYWNVNCCFPLRKRFIH